MELTKLVPSLELCLKLNKFGFNQECIFYWISFDGAKNWRLAFFNGSDFIDFEDNNDIVRVDSGLTYILAPTVSELGEALPSVIRYNNIDWLLKINKWDNKNYEPDYYCDSGSMKNIPLFNMARGLKHIPPKELITDNLSGSLAILWSYLKENKLI